MPIRRVCALLIAFTALFSGAFAANTRMDMNRFNIGAYELFKNARTEGHISDIKECGIDFIEDVEYDKEMLELFEKYDIGCILSGVVPAWWGGIPENAGHLNDEYPIENYQSAAAAFNDMPAVWGIDTGDEPSSKDFPYYGIITDTVNGMFENQFAFLNLHPVYAGSEMWGVPTYKEYIEKYCECVPTDFVCFDCYVYSVTLEDFFMNLETVSDVCKDYSRDMWTVLQVNSDTKERYISLGQLRFQAYSAMAFGSRCILWACYSDGWWENNVLDENGEKTEQYAKLKQVNSEIHYLGERYMKYRREKTCYVGFEGSQNEFSNGVFEGLKADDGRALLVGDLYSDEGNAVFICACDDPYDMNDTETEITFKASQNVRAFNGFGEKPVTALSDGSYIIKIRSNEGVLIETAQ